MAEALSHDRAAELLPWLANGTLEAGEREAVHAHARACVLCRRELEELEQLALRIATSDERALPPPDMRRINARIDAQIGRDSRGPAVLAILRDGLANPWRTAFALQTLVLVALAAAWFMPAEPEAEYTTLTKPAVQADGPYLRAVFDPGLDSDAIASMVAGQGLVIAEGPTPRGVYTLGFASAEAAATRDAVRAALAQDPRVLFVQPVGSGAAE